MRCGLQRLLLLAGLLPGAAGVVFCAQTEGRVRPPEARPVERRRTEVNRAATREDSSRRETERGAKDRTNPREERSVVRPGEGRGEEGGGRRIEGRETAGGRREARPETPSFEQGKSDGGPGEWGKPYGGRNGKGEAYQEKVTGAPPGTEYKVPLERRSSGHVDFDGYDPRRDVLLDAKEWQKWPPLDGRWEKPRREMLEQAEDQIKAARGTPIEWHFPNEAKAREVERVLRSEGVSPRDLKVVVTRP